MATLGGYSRRPSLFIGSSRARWTCPALSLCVLFFVAAFPLERWLWAESNVAKKIELRGRILLPAGTLRPRSWITVNLFPIGTPFHKRTVAQRNGVFTFKNLAAGTYTILFSIPRAGQLTRTIELTPTFADAKGRIESRFEYTPEQLEIALKSDERGTVSVRELQISYSSRKEFEKAQSKLREDDADGALAHLQKAIEASPDFLEAINSAGVIRFQRKQYDEAEKYFRMALAIDEAAPQPRLNLGGVLLAQGKGAEALEMNERAYADLPQDALAAAQLGLSHYLLNDLGQAIRYLDRAKELDPAHYTLPQITLARIFLHLGRAEEAAEEIEEFLKLHPDSPEVSSVRQLEERVGRMMQQQVEDSLNN